MMYLTGAEIVIRCLMEQGVDTVFGYPGGSALNLYDALYRHSGDIRHILMCHEQGAAHAADGYARASGKPGIAISTSGPGATNLVTGIATAFLDSSPLIAITSNVATGLLGKSSFQEVNITSITRSITKKNFLVKDVSKLAGTMRLAFKIAMSGRPGPVLVDIPKDVTGAKADYESQKPEPAVSSENAVNSSDVDRAAGAIEKSRCPLIIAGGGVRLAHAEAELAEFVRRVSAPVAETLMGIGCYPETEPDFTGMIGMHGTQASGRAASECDLLIALGTRFSDRVTCDAARFAPKARILHIDVDKHEIGKNVRADVSVTGDVREVLKMLCSRLPKLRHSEWLSRVAGWKKAEKKSRRNERAGVTPRRVIGELYRLTGGSATVTTEVGQHQMWAAQYYPFAEAGKFITSGGLGTMGFGLGAAIGAQIAKPRDRVVNIAGDGSFYMNMAELSTAVKYNLPVVELVLNNQVLGMVRQWQKLFYGSRFSQSVIKKPTDYVMLAHALGAEGFEIRAQGDICPVLEKALSCNRPCLVNCYIGMDENVLPMVPASAALSEPVLSLD